MNKKSKNTLALILTSIIFVSFAVTGCNNSSETKEAPKDTVATEKKMEVAPAVIDTTKKTGDTAVKASTRPTPMAN